MRAASSGRFLRHGLGRRGEGGDRCRVQGPGADVAFLPSAVLDRRQLHGAAQQQGADAHRAADLVAGDGHGVQSARPEVHGHGAEGLDGVGVHGHAGGVGQLDDFRARAGWCRPRCWPTSPSRGRWTPGPGRARPRSTARSTTPSESTGSQETSAPLVPLQPFDGVQHGMMFDGGAEDPRACRVFGAAGPVQSLDGQVVGLGAARGEDDLRRVGPGGGGNRFAGVLHGAPGAAARAVQR